MPRNSGEDARAKMLPGLRRPPTIIGVVGAVALLWLLVPGPSAELRRDGAYLLLLGSGLTAVAMITRGVRRLQGRERAAWTCIAMVCAINLLGVTANGFVEVLARQPLLTPTPDNLSAVLALPFAAVAGFCLLTMHMQLARLHTILDALILAAAVLLVAWLAVLGPLAYASAPSWASGHELLLVPTSADILYLLVVAAVLLRTDRGERSSMAWLGIGVGFALAGDTAAAYSQLGSTAVVPHGFNALWILAYMAVGLGGLAATTATTCVANGGHRWSRWNGYLPYLAVAAACAAAATALAAGDHLDGPTIWGLLAILGLISARHGLGQRENLQLTDGLHQRSNELRNSELRFRGLVQNSSDLIILLAADGAVNYASESVSQLLGVRDDELSSLHLLDMVHEDDRAATLVQLEAVGRRRGPCPALEFRLRSAAGEWRVIEAVPNNLLADQAVAAVVLTARDITNRREVEEQLRHQALHDPLTGLANRALLRAQLGHTLARCERTGEQVALLFVDLDDFKAINDRHGHAGGDTVLRTIASRIRGALRDSDIAARLGGDEFAILLEGGVDQHAAARIAERIINSVAEPIALGDQVLTVGVSVGLSVGSAGDVADNLLRQADVAMYRAKAGGKGDFAIFHASMDLLAIARLQFKVEMDDALIKGQLAVHYQPIVDLSDGAITGVEALVRWQHPERGLLAPSEFIELAEETGQIVDLGNDVLRTSCEQMRIWREQFKREDLSVAVNISSRHFRGHDLVSDVKAALHETGLPASGLVIEVTESALLADLQESRRQMSALKKLGVRLALDDFGTGYSSLGYLRELPVDILKIDRSFVTDLGRGDRPSEFIRAITTLGRSLELHTVAEGVEQLRQLRLLRSLGVDSAQGFHFAKPCTAEAAGALIARRKFSVGKATAGIRVAGSPVLDPDVIEDAEATTKAMH